MVAGVDHEEYSVARAVLLRRRGQGLDDGHFGVEGDWVRRTTSSTSPKAGERRSQTSQSTPASRSRRTLSTRESPNMVMPPESMARARVDSPQQHLVTPVTSTSARRAHGHDGSRVRTHHPTVDADRHGHAYSSVNVGRICRPVGESIRALRTARSGALKARSSALNALQGMVVTVPAELRSALDTLSRSALVRTCAALRPDRQRLADPTQATKAALRTAGAQDRDARE